MRDGEALRGPIVKNVWRHRARRSAGAAANNLKSRVALADSLSTSAMVAGERLKCRQMSLVVHGLAQDVVFRAVEKEVSRCE